MSPTLTIAPTPIYTYPIKALHFQGMFSKEEKQRLTNWVQEGLDWFQQTFGVIHYPTLTIACSRRCFADGRYSTKKEQVTVKVNSNKEYFIATLIHELAHWVTLDVLKKKAYTPNEWHLIEAFRTYVNHVYQLPFIKGQMEKRKIRNPFYYDLYYNDETEKIARIIEAIYLFEFATTVTIEKKNREFDAITFLSEIAPSAKVLLTSFVDAFNWAKENQSYEARFQSLTPPPPSPPSFWGDEENENLFL